MYQLKKMGSFHVGGRKIQVTGKSVEKIDRNSKVTAEVDPNGTYTIESMYVQYYIPDNCKQVCILIHGGGHSGSIWETTPDGRPGWMHLLLAQGIGVYIVDTVERGRSSWCTLTGIWPGSPEQRTHQRMWSAFRFGSAENFEKRIAFENQKFPINAFDELTKNDIPRWNCNSQVSADNLSLLVKKIGNCNIIAHSQGSDIALRCYNLEPNLIDKIVVIEPAAFPELITHSKKPDLLFVSGDHIQLNSFWQSTYTLGCNYIQSLRERGFKCKQINLPEIGIRGNSHMMMMDTNNDIILDIISRWILDTSKNTTALRSKL